MTQMVRPHFGTRQHTKGEPGEPPADARRVDWLLVALISVAFLAGFVWIVPAFQGRGPAPEAPSRDDAEGGAPSLITVVDGDTVRRDGKTYRLYGFSAPEPGTRAHCARERLLASMATNRLLDLVSVRDVSLWPVSCPCPSGSDGAAACSDARLCGRLKANGRDVGEILIAEGLAERACEGPSCPPPKDWCRE